MIDVIVQSAWYTKEQCNSNPKRLYVFGDNLQEEGCGGQAIIRYKANSIGIPTKRSPGMGDASFFTDSPMQCLKIEQAITEIFIAMTSGKFDVLVFPADGLGTGLSEMPTRSPVLYEYLNVRLRQCFGVNLEIPDS